MARSPETRPSTPDTALKMHVSDMPEELRPYAFGLHAQVAQLYAEMGVSSMAELDTRARENPQAFLPHVGRLRQVRELLPKLREVLSAPREYLAEQNREGAPQWIEHVRDILGILPSTDDPIRDRLDVQKVAMRLQQTEEAVFGTPLIDAVQTAWMTSANPDDSLREVAREAADIAIERGRYAAVLNVFKPESAEFGDPTPKLVQAMIADGRFDEAEKVIERMRSGENGYHREVAYHRLAEALYAKGQPWRDAYNKGVASYENPEPDAGRASARARWEQNQQSTADRRAQTLGLLGCGAEAVAVFLSVPREQQDNDAAYITSGFIAGGAYDAAKDFMRGVGMDEDVQRRYVVRITLDAAEKTTDLFSADITLRVVEAEKAYRETQDEAIRSDAASMLAHIYKMRKQWAECDALISALLPKGPEAEFLRLCIPFLARGEMAGLERAVRYVDEHPEFQSYADDMFSQIVSHCVSIGDLVTAAQWRARIKDAGKDPWSSYFYFALRSGDVTDARKMFADLVERDPADGALYSAGPSLLEAYAKSGDAHAFADLLAVVPVPDDRSAAKRRAKGVQVLFDVLRQAREAVHVAV